MDYKVENLCGFLIRSRLMAPDQMNAMRTRWQSEAKDATQATAFVKWLIAKEYVTEYQATLLSKGLVDDFFLGQYEIMERIGRGRMAGVYRARHPSGQILAIKVLPPSRAKNAQVLARFQREARLSVKLKHPNVVRSFQVGEARGVHYLVMEYLEGDTLDEVIAGRTRLPPQEGVRLVHQALLGLQHIHEQGMIHRDLKPANLMLVPAPTRDSTFKSTIKILDIGLAREFFDENSPAPREDLDLTGEGVLLGTPDYLAPEQARDPRTIDIRADIYSLGCVLYHVLTGQTPFPDKNILTQMIRHATEKPKSLQEFNPSIPEGLSQIVGWMMAKKPEERYPTPARAAQALDAYLMVTTDSTKPEIETPQLKKYLTWLETTEKESNGTPPPAARAAPVIAKPGTNPQMPVLGGKTPLPPTKEASPERKRKKRTGVKMPDAPVALPAVPTSAPAPAALPLSAPPKTVDEYDVELVTVLPPPAARSGKRDVLMFALGAALMFLLSSTCMGVWTAASMFRGE